MDSITDFFQYLLNSEEIIRTGGLVLITLIIFAENGLFFAFFLPGDYLVFLAGIFCALKILNVPIFLLLGCLFGAAILGSLTGYLMGRFFGDRIQNRPDSLFFKKKHIETTRNYFDKYGSRTLVISRFLPVVRTFAPILAGLVKMKWPGFMLYNVLGAGLWIFGLTGGGYYFGEKFPGIINYVHYIIIFFLAITTFTVVRGYFGAKKDMSNEG
ncbi:DedA family protein [Runella slithyformis]|uniref:SNARE associated Golgi protein-like protein n=1 Tax=Runella slithyformis (strain ATCC 29530 / DSM 19594 / LMG 11500 / NCIMB 11436 / LSU 4) TaxID=761193 RepID=A0A7U4E677_RUNSL|nr:VTT domain-containing protein [Runella slithyformis]AEI49248.1 SNARE associated Golgi protein-like protein [Runella slithyformis DSM 19594]